MSEELQRAVAADKRADKRLSIAKNMFFAYLVIVTLFTSVQTIVISQQIRDSLDANKTIAADNHQLTRDYVKCIAITLLKPVAQRNDVDFDNCTKNETQKSSVVQPEEREQNNSVSGTNVPPMQAPQIVIRENKTDETTGAAPPDPDPADPGTSNPTNESRVLTIIDGILKEVNDSAVGGTLSELGL